VKGTEGNYGELRGNDGMESDEMRELLGPHGQTFNFQRSTFNVQPEGRRRDEVVGRLSIAASGLGFIGLWRTPASVES